MKFFSLNEQFAVHKRRAVAVQDGCLCLQFLLDFC